ncbi:MAG: sigma-70 family RNA polymerase sigma factor [Bacilli bacterium]|nr:sigma-70 family RNA polymerase sigma factor [Bacilli bacterium]
MPYSNAYPSHIRYSDKEIVKIYESLPYLTDEEAHMVRNKLIENNLRLVCHIAARFSCTSFAELQDLLSIGNIGLIKAINAYDHTRGIKLATYASRCITNEILMYFRANKKHFGVASLEEIIWYDDRKDGDIELGEVTGTDPDVTERSIIHKAVISVLMETINELSDRDKRLLELKFGLNRDKPATQAQIAEELGLSQSYVSRMQRKVLSNLRKKVSPKICD